MRETKSIYSNFLILLCFCHSLTQSMAVNISANGNAGQAQAQGLGQVSSSFSIDYENDCFIKDGQPFQYVSGSMEYFRVVRERWGDILVKMRMGGLNAVQIYVEWSSHQPKPEDKYMFNGNLDLLHFLELAQANNLLVILRPGPYIDAERDMGGLPAWLLWKYPNIKLRSTDSDFMYEVSKWFAVLLNLVNPYLYNNGGPIIMIQVENEYGSYSCDQAYTAQLRDVIKAIVGENVVLFTTDYAEKSKLQCGRIPGVYSTVDFGTEAGDSVQEHFAAQRLVSPKGPLVNSEFYSGWFDRWGQPHQTTKTKDVTKTLDEMLSLGANVNIYMYHGGVSFGLRSGSTTDNITRPGGFQSCISSYDFDSPLNEAGDPTDKYFEIKRIIGKYKNVPSENPSTAPKGNYGEISLGPLVSILDEAILEMFASNPISSSAPMRFEELPVASGFVLYETSIDFQVWDPAILSVKDLRDRAYIYVRKELVGMLSRSENVFSTSIFIEKGEILQILVESQGRPSFGEFLGESKGLGPEVRLGSRLLQNWRMYPLGELNIKNLQKFLKKVRSKSQSTIPIRKSAMTFIGTFVIGNKTNPDPPVDTFVRFDGWRKGIIWINNVLLGRYWPAIGPQLTLYVPAPLLLPYPAKNYVTLLELESVPTGCTEFSKNNLCFVELTDKHVLNGTTPG